MARYLYVNSADRINSFDTSTNFQVKFSSMIGCPTKVKLHSAIIPMTLWNIPIDTKFTYRYAGGEVTVYPTPGNYTLPDVAQQLEDALNNTPGLNNWSVDYTPEHYNFLVQNGTTQFQIRYDDKYTSPALKNILGEHRTSGYSDYGTGYAFPMAACWRDFHRTLFFNIRELKTEVKRAYSPAHPNFTYTFCIQNTVNNGDILFFRALEGSNAVVCQNRGLIGDTLTVQLLNENGDIVDLNESEISLVLELCFD